MAPNTALITADELLRMPDDGFHRYEVVAGRSMTMAPACSLHGAVGMRLGAILTTFVEERGLGVVFNGDTGFKLAADPDTVRAADVSFVRHARVVAEG